MRTVIFVPTAKTINGEPSPWLAERLECALLYYLEHPGENCQIVVSGRWGDAFTTNIPETEAQTAKRYLLSRDPDLKIATEDYAVETGGNFAFSKPLIAGIDPNIVVIVTSRVLESRTRYFARKVFGTQWNYKFIFVDDSLSENPRARAKEPKALAMFQALFAKCDDSNDSLCRDILVKDTPFYEKGAVSDVVFFDKYWPGGYQDFLDKRKSIDNK